MEAILPVSFLPLVRKLLTLLHSERPKLYTILVLLSAIGLKEKFIPKEKVLSFKSIPHVRRTLSFRKVNWKSHFLSYNGRKT